MSNGALRAREREDLALHVERCAERYEAVSAEIGELHPVSLDTHLSEERPER